MNRPTVAGFCISLFAGGILLAAPAALAAPGPDADSPARPAGKWTCWSGNSSFGPTAATPKALWLAGHTAGHVWRYDLKTRQSQVFSALDGLPLDDGSLVRIVAAPDEQCAILVIRNLPKPRVFHWNPKDGWRAAPLPPQNAQVLDIAFDANSNLLALHGSGDSTAIYRLEGKQWRRAYTVPQSNCLVPLAGGLAAIEQCSDRSKVHYIPAADPDKLTSTTGPFFNRQHFFYFRAGEKTLCLPNANVAEICNQSTACDLDANGFHECFKGSFIGADLKAGGFLDCRVIEKTDEHIVLEPNMPSPPRVELRYDTHSGFEPFRDQNGDLWFGRRRWDGRQWKQFTSGFELPTSVYVAADGDLARLSDDGRTWALVDANMPPRALARDAAACTAWQMTSRSGKSELRLIRYYKGGRDILRTVPYESFPGSPRFKTPDGDWWTLNYGVNGSTRKVCRLTPRGTREYPTEGYDMILSPAGNVWCRQDATFTRYNPTTDKFEPGEPWEEFAFTVGKLRLSCFANDNGGILYRKKGEAWEPFLTPFTSTQALVGKNCARGDRILMAAGQIGVLEYDARTDQWARLTDTCSRAAFDHSGRRMLFGFCMLVYDGDPLAGVKPAGNDDDDADKEFRRLLELMDDDRWKVRDEATRKLAENMGRFARRAAAAADDPSLSLEVRVRLQTILPQGKTFPPAPPPLLRTMHPPLTPPP